MKQRLPPKQPKYVQRHPWMNEIKQIFTLISLKAKLTFRSYSRNTLATIQSLFFVFFILLFALVLAFGVVASFLLMREYLGNSYIPIMVLSNLLWGIYGLWILVPVFGFRMNESYDISKLLHLPVKRWTIFMANILGNFADLTIAIPIAALGGILIIYAIDTTIGTFDPLVFLFNTLALFIFLINMIICGQLVVIFIYNILPRVPVWRILLYILIIGGVITWAWFKVQASVNIIMSIFDIVVLQKLYVYFPHGLATYTIYHGSLREWDIAVPALIGLTLHTVVLGIITGALFAKWYAGGNVEGTPVGQHGRRRNSFAEYISAFWSKVLGGILPRQALEIMRKDHLNLLRNRSFIIYKGVPAILGPAIVMFAIWYSTTHYTYIMRSSTIHDCFVYTAIIFSAFIITAQANLFAGNLFGFEGEGIFSTFTTEVDKRMVLLGKNAFLLTLFVIDTFVFGCFTWLLMSNFFIGLMTFLLLFNLFILLVATGNFASALLPYRYDLERPAVSPQQVILIAIVESISAMISFIMLIPALLLLLVPFAVHFPLLLIICVPLSFAYSFLWLWVSIRLAGPLVERLEQAIMLKVSEP